MRKVLLNLLPAVLVLVVFDVQAKYIPYVKKPGLQITPAQYDKNNDSKY